VTKISPVGVYYFVLHLEQNYYNRLIFNLKTMNITHSDNRTGVKLAQIRVVVADDHELILQALGNILCKETDIDIVGEAKDGEAAVALADKLKPDIVMMDIKMPLLDGIEATKKIKGVSPQTKVIILTAFDDNEYILGTLEVGASGYLLKDIIGEDIPTAIRAVYNGESMLSENVMRRLLCYALRYPNKNITLKREQSFSKIEIRILQLMAKGESNKIIASELNLSLNTVKKYIMNIFEKLDVHSRTAAILNAQRIGLISIDKIGSFET
jgi:DNA-binding NarL/FixJ family response regulator